MYESQTKAEILQRMLDASPSDIDKRQGSVTWDLLSPAAIELAKAYIALDHVLNIGFADTTYGHYLDLKVSEYGLTRKPAIKATSTLTFSGPNGTLIPSGTRASTGGSSPVYFVTTVNGTISDGLVTVSSEAVASGTTGNVAANTIKILTGDLVGIATVTNPANFDGGADEEGDAALLARYFDRARLPVTSGNANQYTQWAKSIAGISNAKVYPVWNGAGTVKVVLLDSDSTAPNAGKIAEVSDYIETVRPIGAAVTVAGATEVPINVSVDVSLAEGATLPQVTLQLTQSITDYLKTLAFTDPLVRYTQIQRIILDVPSVVDYTALTVNGGVANVNVADGSVAVIGTVSVI